MTKSKDFYTLSGVVGRAIDFLTKNGVSDAIGVSRDSSIVYQYADGDNATVLKDVNQLERLDIACLSAGKSPPFLTYYARRIGSVERPGGELDDRVLKLVDVVGTLVEHHRKARKPDSPNGSGYSKCEEVTAEEIMQELYEVFGEVKQGIADEVNPISMGAAAE